MRRAVSSCSPRATGPAQRLVEVLRAEDLPARLDPSLEGRPEAGVVHVSTGCLLTGFSADPLRLVVLTETDLAGQRTTTKDMRRLPSKRRNVVVVRWPARSVSVNTTSCNGGLKPVGRQPVLTCTTPASGLLERRVEPSRKVLGSQHLDQSLRRGRGPGQHERHARGLGHDRMSSSARLVSPRDVHVGRRAPTTRHCRGGGPFIGDER